MSIRLEALPALDDAIAQLTQLAAAQGITFTIADFGGFRTAADTAQILGYRDDDYAVYAANAIANGNTPMSETSWRPIAPYGKSYHDYGAARDLRIVSAPAGMSSADALAQLGQLAPAAGLKWGNSFNDPAHFQLAVSLADAKAAWQSYAGGTNLPAPIATSSSAGTWLAIAGGVAFIWWARRRTRRPGARA